MEEKKRVTAMLTDSEAVLVKEFIHVLRNNSDLIDYFRCQSSPFEVLLRDFSEQKLNGTLDYRKKYCYNHL